MSTSFFDDDDEDNFDAHEARPAAGPAPALHRPGGGDRNEDEIQLPPPLKDRYQAQAAAGPSHQHAPAARRHRQQSSAAAMDLDVDVDDLVDDIIAPELGGPNAKGKGREDELENEVERLMRRWMDERMAPELLRCDEELMAAAMERLEAQVSGSLACTHIRMER